jgi:hypothetical protein
MCFFDSQLQKNALKPLTTLSRAQKRTPLRASRFIPAIEPCQTEPIAAKVGAHRA